MRREELISRLDDSGDPWDFIIIGGGASGLGTAIDAANRGYRTLLLEQSDFAKGTSSRSTKLVHGGVRYLQQGNIALVRGALHERGLLRENAPHLVSRLPFIIPNYRWWEGGFYGIGLRVYDVLAGKLSFGKSQNLSRDDTIERLPTIETHDLRGGVLYYDAQFDDARLALNMAQTAFEQGATPLNYMQVVSLQKENETICGVVARDLETDKEYTLKAKVVINATGVFTDSVRRMDNPDGNPMISPSQGGHIVLDRSFLPGDSALMVPHTDDGRVLFAIPWHGVVIVGTTDTPMSETPLEPRLLEEELDFLLRHTGKYLAKTPRAEDVLSIYAGLRPLVKSPGARNTAAISRDHTIRISKSGLVTLAGGKWTTYRKMAEDTVNRAAKVAGLKPEPCKTQTLKLHGAAKSEGPQQALDVYGSDATEIQKLIYEDPSLGEALHPDLELSAAQVIWAVRNEMARTVEDVLARRTRNLLLNARASIEVADQVAQIMAKELERSDEWATDQASAFSDLAQGYLMH